MFKRLFEKTKNSWGYILREVLLIFLGINLAIWFNNWNESKKIREDKNQAMVKVMAEIKSNRTELESAMQVYQNVIDSYDAHKDHFVKNTSTMVATPQEMNRLQSSFPNFFKIKDSLAFDTKGQFRYLGSTKIELELPVLTNIAWLATTSTNISSELDFDCMYQLESVYNIQRKVQLEIDKASDALQSESIERLIRILKFLNQLAPQLQESYRDIETQIGDCA